MGQGNTGVSMRSGAETTLRYLEAKRKNRKTLTLKKKSQPFESTANFSSTVVRASQAGTGVLDNLIPLLTNPVTPAAAGVIGGVSVETIPVLDTPLSGYVDNTNTGGTDARHQKPKVHIKGAVLFALLVVLGIFLFGDVKQEPIFTTLSINQLLENDVNLDVSENRPVASMKKTGVAKKSVDQTLIHNLIELILKEQFSQGTTIEAFLGLWQQLDTNDRSQLNATPEFLRFAFSIQKNARDYLQSPDSYHADYTIRENALLRLALAMDVMDQHGIQSNIENYQSKQNQLIESLKTDIATVEHAVKKQIPTDESVAALSESLKQRFAARTVRIKREKPVQEVTTAVADNTAQLTPVSRQPETAAANVTAASTAVVALELDSLVTRFIESYEIGDLEGLTALFSEDAKTNDRNSLQGIRKDYSNLFNSSSFRILNVINLRWIPAAKTSIGMGDYEIAIAMNDPGQSRTLHGKIQFEVTRIDDQLRITRLYHLER